MEGFVSRIRQMQGYDNYADYELLRIADKEYLFSCRCSLAALRTATL